MEFEITIYMYIINLPQGTGAGLGSKLTDGIIRILN